MAANLGLAATSGYLIAKAATHPPTILLLWVPIVAVRFFGIARAVFRYLERLVSHDVTLRIVAQLRTRLYQSLEPRWPLLMPQWRMGALLDLWMVDLEVVQNVFLRVISPSLVACLAIGIAVWIGWQEGGGSMAAAWFLGLVTAGFALPALARWQNARHSPARIAARSALEQHLTDLIHGVAEALLAEDGGQRALARTNECERELYAVERRMAKTNGLLEASAIAASAGTAWLMLRIAMAQSHSGGLSASASRSS